ncbi:hypothetical protein IWC96_14460 [Brevundimonas sp. BAL450]|uniref:hypothetical protein n=1 Tax=Brevundimonas sp. BAL450 TaxID=1708162 RepID=UPI0018CABBC9|nr:hypothetical protein [Brevundimonas sp. BAL450]MBG7616477.1 hypothetical protein [Brevundimonas sp. BAL450]
MSQQGRHYIPDGVTLERYLASNPYTAPEPYAKALSCIQGPIRSGTSVASCMRLMEAAMNVPVTQGKRRSRWLIVRNTYPDLEASTIKTWLEWFPEAVYGRFYWTAPFLHEVRFGDVEADFHFESFSGDDDIPSLMSREYTGGWINEAQFFSRKFTVTLLSRTGYFPVPDGPKFLQLDMNAPPIGHWIPMMRGDGVIPEEMDEGERRSLVRPDDWEFHVQPAWFVEDKDERGFVTGYRINPDAENINILGEKNVLSLLDGRTTDEIDAELMNRVLIQQPGRPVFPMFSRDVHVSKAPLKATEGVTLHVGLDFGRQPAMVVAQCVGGRWSVLDEMTGSNMAAEDFAPMVKRRLALKFPGWGGEGQPDILFWGDPSGDSKRSEVDDRTAFDIFAKNGMQVRKADNAGRRAIRIETFTSMLNRMIRGEPAVLVSSTCATVVTALAGGYCYKRKRVSGSPTYDTEPDKTGPYSHPVDAMLEIFMGGGESRTVLGRAARPQRVNTLRRVNPYDRGPRSASKVFAR